METLKIPSMLPALGVRASHAAPIIIATDGRGQSDSAVVVVDFSETSLRAAQLALQVASSNATIYLAHVAPRDSTLYDWKGWGISYKDDAGDALQKTREQLRAPKDMIVQKLVLQGDTAT